MHYLFIIVIVLSSCHHHKIDEQPKLHDIYESGIKNLESQNYEKAIDNFEKIQLEYPLDRLSSHAHILEIYTYFLKKDYTNCALAAENFILLHPAHKDIAYIYYIKAAALYNEIVDVKHDQDITIRAKQALEEVITHFPNSSYAKDVKIKIDLVNDHLAGKEMNIARFYLKKKVYTAALNRFMTVVKHYDTSMQIEEALYRICEIYNILNLTEDANKYVAILGYNYPKSKWYERAIHLGAQDKKPWYKF